MLLEKIDVELLEYFHFVLPYTSGQAEEETVPVTFSHHNLVSTQLAWKMIPKISPFHIKGCTFNQV